MLYYVAIVYYILGMQIHYNTQNMCFMHVISTSCLPLCHQLLMMSPGVLGDEVVGRLGSGVGEGGMTGGREEA